MFRRSALTPRCLSMRGAFYTASMSSLHVLAFLSLHRVMSVTQPQAIYGQQLVAPPLSATDTAPAGVTASLHCPTYAGNSAPVHGTHTGASSHQGFFHPGVSAPPHQHVSVQGAGYLADPQNQGPFLRAPSNTAVFNGEEGSQTLLSVSLVRIFHYPGTLS